MQGVLVTGQQFRSSYLYSAAEDCAVVFVANVHQATNLVVIEEVKLDAKLEPTGMAIVRTSWRSQPSDLSPAAVMTRVKTDLRRLGSALTEIELTRGGHAYTEISENCALAKAMERSSKYGHVSPGADIRPAVHGNMEKPAMPSFS